jgi:transcriptional regulator with XRE-family HTH domain
MMRRMATESSVTASSPTVWRRWLAFELRRLRVAQGLSQAEAGKRCGWSGARVSYLENAQRSVSEADLEKLLPLYEVPTNQWATYMEAVEKSRGKGWWQRLHERVVAPWLSLYVGLEQGAAEIRAYEAVVIPGLLQTPEYAAAVERADVVPRTEAQVQERVQVRINRQRVLERETDPLKLWTVIDEAALTRVAGGPEVMAAQLDHLVEMAKLPNVGIQVLPFSMGVMPYATGPFYILGFPWASDPGIVYVEHRDGALYLEESHEVQGHVLVFQHLCTLALPFDDSVALLEERAERMRS